MQDKVLRTSPCVCGSGLRFKACCGAHDAPHWNAGATGRLSGSLLDPKFSHLVEHEPIFQEGSMRLPPGILAVQTGDQLPWRAVTSGLIDSCSDTLAHVRAADGSSSTDRQRVTGVLQVDDIQQSALVELTRRAYEDFVEPFFNLAIRWFESPQVLRYRPGGYYGPHSDADFWHGDSRGWEKILDRDLSMLLYLDDGYEGGELIFPNFDFRLKPKPGMLVAFPSDSRYLHGAMPIISGSRHVLVGWSSVVGQPRVKSEIPKGATIVAR